MERTEILNIIRRNGYSPSGLSKKLGITHGFMSKLIWGIQCCKPEIAKKIVDIIGNELKIEYFIKKF